MRLFMKPLRIFTCIAMIFILIHTGVFASVVQTREIPGLDMTISLDGDYYIITRNSTEDDPFFDILGTTHAQLMQTFDSRGIYLSAVSFNSETQEVIYTPFTEITVSAIDTDFAQEIFHMNSMSELEMQWMGQMFLDTDYSAAGFDDGAGLVLDRYRIADINSNKYLVFNGSIGSGSVYQYMTIINGQVLAFTLESRNLLLTAEQILDLDSMVNSVYYRNIKEPPSVSASNFLLTLIVMSVVGIIICIVFIFSIRSRKKWMNHMSGPNISKTKSDDSSDTDDLTTNSEIAKIVSALDIPDGIESEIIYAKRDENDKNQSVNNENKLSYATPSPEVKTGEEDKPLPFIPDWEVAQESHIDYDFEMTMLELNHAQGLIDEEEYNLRKRKFEHD